MLTPAQKSQFLNRLRQTGSVTVAAKGSGMPRSSLYSARDADARFRADWDAALGRAPVDGPPAAAAPSRPVNMDDLTPRQRRLVMELLSPEPAPPPTPVDLAQDALNGWLRGEPWPAELDRDVVDALRHLSVRAWESYRAEAAEAPPSWGGPGEATDSETISPT